MNALSLALLLTLTGPEVSRPVHNLGDFALVPVRDGFVMAWSEGMHIYAARLDGDLHPSGTPFSFPLVLQTSVTSLAVADDGASILVVWHEVAGVNTEAVYSATLDGDAQSMIAGPLFMTMDTQPPVAAVKDGLYRVLARFQLWTFDDRLGVKGVESLDAPDGAVSDTLSSSGVGGTASQTRTSHCNEGGFSPTFFWTSCDFKKVVTFSAPAGVKTFDFAWNVSTMGGKPTPGSGSDPVVQTPAIAPNGDGFVGTLVTPGGALVFEVRSGGREWPLASFIGAPPVIAGGNGNDIAVVWRDTALRLIVLHAEGTTSAPMILSDTGYAPKVVAAGTNQLVVLYRSSAGGDLLNARIIRSHPSRNRAVR